MKKRNEFLISGIATLVIFIGLLAYTGGSLYQEKINVGAPQNSGNILRNLTPETDSIYYLGTTTKAWFETWTDKICLTGDACYTSISAGSGAPFAWTGTGYGVSTSTTLGFLNGFLSTASSTITGNLYLTSASTTQLTVTNDAWLATTGGNVGIGTTSPFAKLSIHANNGETNTTLFSIASSTASATTTLFSVSNNGNIFVNSDGDYTNPAIAFSGTNSGFKWLSSTASGIEPVHGGNSTGLLFTSSYGMAIKNNKGIVWSSSGNPASGSNDIGLARDSAGVLRISDGSTGLGNIITSGVGIGTTSPTYKLSVEGTSTLGNQAIAGYFTATSTSATSTMPKLEATTLKVATAIEIAGEYISNFTNYVRSLFTGGTGITLTTGDISFDCSEVEGTGIDCTGEAITLDATGDWTGTFDGYNGPAIAMGTTSVASITTLSNLVTVGALNSGSISTGFGAIDVGADNITTTGLGTFGNLSVTNATTSTLYITGLGTPAGTFIAIDPNGQVIATSTPGGGDVSKVGTPADNQVGVWTGDGTIEGTAGLTYDGSNFQLTGDIGSTGTRITKGWFTDLEVTNAIAGSITGNAGTVTNGVYTNAANAFSVGGQTITVDNTTNVVGLTINQNDVTNNPSGLNIINAGSGAEIDLQNTRDGAAGSVIEMYQNSASPADSDIIGKIAFYGEDSVSAKTNYTNIYAYTGDVTNGTEGGGFQVDVADSTGGLANAIDFYIDSLNGAMTIGGSDFGGTFYLDSTQTGYFKSNLGTGVTFDENATPKLQLKVTDGILGVGSSTTNAIIQSIGNYDLILQTGNGTTGSITITDGANGNITLAPNGTGDVALGSADLTMTGSIAATGSRVTKVWAVDIEATNMPTVGGTSLSSTFSPIAGSASIVTTGALNSGSITSGFGNIDIGASNFDADGTITSTGVIDFGGSTSIEIVNGASPTVNATGEIAVDTTSDQLIYYGGSSKKVLVGNQYPAFTYATSTAWTATTTIPLGTAFVGETWNAVQCFTDTGTLNVSFYDGTNRMNMFNASTTVGTVTLSTNNTFTAGEKRYVDVGTPASSPTKISCTVSKSITAD